MPNIKIYSGLFVLIACIIVAVSFTGYALSQSAREKEAKSPDTQDEALVRLSAPEAESAAFSAASLRNAKLLTDLPWSLGGKPQQGWELYVPLISEMIGTNADVRSGRFALALKLWQEGNGLEPTGALDGDTWYRMIETFQARRIKNRVPPPESHLVTAPISDFYDPTRPDELRKVERRAYAAYKRMIRAAVSDSSLGLAVTAEGELAEGESYLKIISSYRSREYQAQLRKNSPGSGRAGLAINSPHFTGRALDIYVGGDPVSTGNINRALQVQTPVYRWLVKNASRFGFRPYFYEPWHWEYTGED